MQLTKFAKVTFGAVLMTGVISLDAKQELHAADYCYKTIYNNTDNRVLITVINHSGGTASYGLKPKSKLPYAIPSDVREIRIKENENVRSMLRCPYIQRDVFVKYSLYGNRITRRIDWVTLWFDGVDTSSCRIDWIANLDLRSEGAGHSGRLDDYWNVDTEGRMFRKTRDCVFRYIDINQPQNGDIRLK